MLPILQIGPLALPVPELLMLLSFWLGLELTERHAPRFQADANAIYHLILIALAAGLVGARLAYAARFPAVFLESPLSLLTPRPQMLDASGGLLAAAAAALIYGQRKHLPLWPTLDALTSLFTVMAVALGLAHLASGDAFGAPAQVPWAIYLWGEMRHPSQIYEILAAALILAAVWPGGVISRQHQAFTQPGMRFWTFLALSAVARLLLEGFRGDSILLMDSLRQAQLAAWLVLALSLWQIGKRLPQKMPTEKPHVAEG